MHGTYEDDDDSDGGFYNYLLAIAIDVSLFLTVRLCSRIMRDLIDGIVQLVVKSIIAISPKARPSLINDVESKTLLMMLLRVATQQQMLPHQKDQISI